MTVRNVFIWCSEDTSDLALLRSLRDHLASLERSQRVSIWDGSEILPGGNRESEIDERLRAADIILLLTSPSFVASDHCYRIAEYAMGRANTARVMLVRLRPAVLTFELSRLESLPHGEEVTAWRSPDQAFVNVAAGIETVINELNAPEVMTRALSIFEGLRTAKKLENDSGREIYLYGDIPIHDLVGSDRLPWMELPWQSDEETRGACAAEEKAIAAPFGLGADLELLKFKVRPNSFHFRLRAERNNRGKFSVLVSTDSQSALDGQASVHSKGRRLVGERWSGDGRVYFVFSGPLAITRQDVLLITIESPEPCRVDRVGFVGSDNEVEMPS